MGFLATPEFWVAAAFIGFVALVIYLKAPAIVAKALDERADAIRSELEGAQRLREEAQAMLADYQRRQRAAEKEAADIVTMAKQEAESFAAEARAKLEESLARRTKMAEEKIAQAEAQATKDVRAAAADAAIAAATALLADEVKGDKAAGLIDDGIKQLKGKLN